ncbi:proline-rich nuclear receptor coactivator 2 [Diachasma alloeum]|uniref:proline-rich nuclear receptor coactivator 2 n=1 Tax=Diachasma alloeum TaxID=454923 RepID=UPI000738429B|nr:proline-rich nuclear receptor coactivator 2 [Diachasma alloeum]
MTNSAPKMSNRVERQGSPNTGGKRNRGGTIKSSSYFNSSCKQVKNSPNGRQSCSPQFSSKNGGNSPMRHDSPRHGSPTNAYFAGAKWSEPPSPASLPKPPSHWTTRLMTSCQAEACHNISNHLKMILNIQA